MSDSDSMKHTYLHSDQDALSRTSNVHHEIALRQAASPPASEVIDAYPERANLYRLALSSVPARLYLLPPHEERRREEVRFVSVIGAREVPANVKYLKRALHGAILERVDGRSFKRTTMGDLRFPLIIDMSVNHVLPFRWAGSVSHRHHLNMYSAYAARVMYFGGAYYFCAHHRLLARTLASLSEIEAQVHGFRPDPGQHVFIRDGSVWLSGRLVSATESGCRIAVDGSNDMQASKDSVILDLTHAQIIHLAPLFFSWTTG